MGNLYLIKLENNTESFYKIGICSRLFSRFWEMKKYYNVTVIYFILNLKGSDSLNLEQFTQCIFEDYQYIPSNKFSGYLECFNYVNEPMFMEIVLDKINYDFEYYHNINLGYNGRLD